MSQKPALGKGLASLFPQANMGLGAMAAGPATTYEQAALANKDRHPGISFAELDDIQPNPNQPRRDFSEEALQELSLSIQTNGIIQPIVVRKTALGKYELIAGERRLRAARMAGLKQIPIVIRKSTDRESLELALVENIQRQNLNCVDEALAYFQLMEDFSLTQEDVAKQVGKDRASVANHLRLLRLPEAIIDDLKRQILSFGHGKALLGLDDSELRLRARKEIIEKKLSVRDTEALVERLKVNSRPTTMTTSVEPPTPVKQRMQGLAQDLSRQYSVKVEMRGTERRGKLVFNYSSRQELDRLLEAMQN